MVSDFFLVINYVALSYFATVGIIYTTLLLISYFAILRYQELVHMEEWRRVIKSPTTIPISVIAPAYNEEVTIVESVRSLLTLQYPRYEVIVVNDGSKDKTLEVLKSSFGLTQIPTDIPLQVESQEILGIYRSPMNPNLVVVDKKNGGKADALNAGLNVSRYPLFCAIDADSMLEGHALLRITRPFLEKPELTVAAGGIVRVANGCLVQDGRVLQVGLSKNWLAIMQTMEYLRAFLFGRTGWAAVKGMLIISGAFGVFKKSVVIEVGGFAADSVGEDMELVVRIHHFLIDHGRKYDIHFVPDPVCWTEVPESFKILARQRNRWQRGLIDTLRRHKQMLFRPKYGVLGMVAFPYFVFYEAMGPIVELFGLVIVPICWALGILSTDFLYLFLSLAIVLGIALSIGSVALEELTFQRYPRFKDVMILVLAGIVDNFGYRQVHAWWRLMGIVDYFRKKSGWGKMERKGLSRAQNAVT